jgi:hypothetical protein
MPGGDETIDDPVLADVRNFYKVELWTNDDRIERMLFAGTSPDRALTVFADYARHRPAVPLKPPLTTPRAHPDQHPRPRAATALESPRLRTLAPTAHAAIGAWRHGPRRTKITTPGRNAPACLLSGCAGSFV